jgi:hypothetical protein
VARRGADTLPFAEEVVDLVDRAPDDLQIDGCRSLMLGRAGEGGQASRAEVGACALERMCAGGPWRPRLKAGPWGSISRTAWYS